MKLKKLINLIKLFFLYLFLNAFRRDLLKKNIWLISEKKTEARDNGYHFFKFMRENHQELNVYYVIKTDSVDLRKIEMYGNIIRHGSFKHYLYYLSARYAISSQPNGAAPEVDVSLFRKFRKNQKTVFLQHGIIKDRLPTLNSSRTKFDLFTCSSSTERDFVCATNGYSKKQAQLLGLCRFDNLHNVENKTKKQILVMPTFRKWLVSKDRTKYATNAEIDKFIESEYYLTFSALLSNDRLKHILYEHGYELIFYPHYSLQSYVKTFEKFKSEIVIIADRNSFDVQELLIESQIMITDYSSVFFDFAYMKKPLIYFQFDQEKFRNGHYDEGYFDYERDGFGFVAISIDEVLSELKKILDNNSKIEKKYIDRNEKFFDLRDNKNCERTYEAILELTGD